MESTVAEVLILNGLGDDGFYKMVTGVSGKILGEFEGLRRRRRIAFRGADRGQPRKYHNSITYYYYMSRINRKPFVWYELMGLRMQGIWRWEKIPGDPRLHEPNSQGWGTPSEKDKVKIACRYRRFHPP